MIFAGPLKCSYALQSPAEFIWHHLYYGMTFIWHQLTMELASNSISSVEIFPIYASQLRWMQITFFYSVVFVLWEHIEISGPFPINFQKLVKMQQKPWSITSRLPERWNIKIIVSFPFHVQFSANNWLKSHSRCCFRNEMVKKGNCHRLEFRKTPNEDIRVNKFNIDEVIKRTKCCLTGKL